MVSAEEMEPAGHQLAAASGTPARDRLPARCAVPSVHPSAGPGCATRSGPGRAPAVAMIAARHRSPSAPP